MKRGAIITEVAAEVAAVAMGASAAPAAGVRCPRGPIYGSRAARGALCVALATAVLLLTATPGLAAPRDCFSLRVQGADMIQAWNMTCRSAARVARAWVAAHYRYGGYNHTVLGFHCRTGYDNVEGAVTTCRRRRERLYFYPSV